MAEFIVIQLEEIGIQKQQRQRRMILSRTRQFVAKLFCERETIIQTGKVVSDAQCPEAGISQLELLMVFLELVLVIA